ncbi:MAG: hypothetical protein JSV84_02070 [Gemmatimonadota bacterium]|nr:MAG: hypothetical protein JSV84_02070 [Gemmatimonadota bacterium]
MKRTAPFTFIAVLHVMNSLSLFAQTTGTEMKTGGYVQVRYTSDENSIDEFQVRRARLKCSGDLLKNMSFLILFDAVSTPILWKAHIDINYKPWITLRLGQFKTPFSNEYLTSSAKLSMIDRAQVVSNLSTKYDIGLQVSGSFKILSYSLGVFNGSGKNTSDENDWKDVVGMIVAKPFNEAEMGFSHYRGKSGEERQKKNRTGIYMATHLGLLSLGGEYIYAEDGSDQRDGWFVQAAYSCFTDFQGLVRYDTYDPDRDVSDDTSAIIILGLNVFIHNNSKVQINYLLRDDGDHSDALKAQFQTTF